ncbi:hypothetical protein AAMO2058_001565200 [Amorphochlora amoebiformis]
MDDYRTAAKQRYLLAKQREREGKQDAKSKNEDTKKASERSTRKLVPGPSATKTSSQTETNQVSGFDSKESPTVFAKLLGEPQTRMIDYEESLPMKNFVEILEKRLEGVDVTAPIVHKGYRVWPLSDIEPPKQLQTEIAQKLAKIHRRTHGEMKAGKAWEEVKQRMAVILGEREAAAVEDIKTRLMEDLKKLNIYFQNQLKPTVGSLGIQPNSVLIAQSKEHTLATIRERHGDTKWISTLGLDESKTVKDSHPEGWKKLPRCTDIQMGKFWDPFRSLIKLRNRSRSSEHQEVYDVDRSLEFASTTLTRRMLKICAKYYLFRRFIYLPMEAVASTAQAAAAVMEKTKHFSPFDWMTDQELHEELHKSGEALALAIREVIRVSSMINKICVWDYRKVTFLLGLHKRVGGGMLRWCRTSKIFDPHCFTRAFELTYPPSDEVIPKLFPIPFMREYISVIQAYALRDVEDDHLEIPRMGEEDHDNF